MIGGLFFKSLSGVRGEVTVPSIGLSVGTMVNWQLSRREETPPEAGEWTLRAAFSYINALAFGEPTLDKRITVTLGDPRNGGRMFMLQMTGNARTALDGRSLMIEGVVLCPLQMES